jgi:uncharacterized membrane protein YdjX (TVP38/TMEM64 family)
MIDTTDRPKVIAFGLGGTVLILLSIYITQNGYLTRTLLWLGALGWIGNLLFIIVYTIVSFPVPIGTTPFILIAGFLYGVIVGFITVTIGAMIGAAISFVVCRRVLASWVERKLVQRQQVFGTIVRAIEKHAFKICLMMRMAPIPFGLQNALFAVCNSHLYKYVRVYLRSSDIKNEVSIIYTRHRVWTNSRTCSNCIFWKVMTNSKYLNQYHHSTTKHLSEFFSGDHEPESQYEQVFIFCQIFVCIVLLALLVRIGKKAFNDAVQEEEKEEEREQLNDSIEMPSHSLPTQVEIVD